MVLYLLGILVALAIAALLWQQRKSSNNWQRQFTFFVDLLALSATALVVGVLAMVQLANPPAPATAGDMLVSAPADVPVEPLPGDGVPVEEPLDVMTDTEPAESTAEPTATRRATRTPNEASATPRSTATPRATPTATPQSTGSPEATVETEATETVAATPTLLTTRAVPPTRTPRATATPGTTATAEATAAPPPPAPTAGNRVHRVAEGETLIEIARRYNVTVNAILAANPGMNADSLRIGQELVIPPPGSDAPPPAAPAPTTTTYTVREGDTLGTIARDLGTTVAVLQRLNPGLVPERLRIGQVLVVPR